MFGDDFAGAAGSAPSSANWFYDIGTGFGTGRSSSTTSSTSNVYLDGNGHLVLKAINSGGSWTSGADREHPRRLPGPARRRTGDDRVDRAAGSGERARVLAGVLGPRVAHAGGRRLGPAGEIDMMEDVNGLNEAAQSLHDAAGSSGHALIACPAAGSGCQTGYHTYSVIVNRTNTSAEYPAVPHGRHGGEHGHRGASSAPPPGRRPSTTASSSSSTWPWAAITRTDLRLHDPDFGHDIRRVDERVVRSRIREGR